MNSLPRRVDVAIVGGGPGGTATALRLARGGARVLVIERAIPRPILGESLPPAATPLLEALNLGSRLRTDGHRVTHATHSAWGTDAITAIDFVRQPYGTGWSLDRARFDALLREAVVEAGGTVAWGAHALACARRCGHSWELTFAVAGERHEVQADWVVDASGRVRRVARACGARVECHDRLVGLVGVFGPTSSGADADAPTLVEATDGGWWYAASLPAGCLIVAYLSDADLIAPARMRTSGGWMALLGMTTHIRERVARQGSSLEQSPYAICARTSCLDVAAGDGWCAVGDAAATHDPLSSLGITHALASGSRAAEAISGSGQGGLDAYARWMTDRYAWYVAEWLGYYAAEQRWATAPFWHRRHAAWRSLVQV